MTVEAWLAAVRAARPQLNAAQLAALRPACQRMAAHLAGKQAAPAEAGAAMTEPLQQTGVAQ